jgi:hypothetical protein
LLLDAELEVYVVITFDKYCRQLIRQVPTGSRSAVARHAGRIGFSCREDQALPRLRELLRLVEIMYEHSQRQEKRFIIQISATSYTVSG